MAFVGPALGAGAAAGSSALSDSDLGLSQRGPQGLCDAQALPHEPPTTWLVLFIAHVTEEEAEAQRD